MSKKIVQIIPAEGWRAVYVYADSDDPEDVDAGAESTLLVAWALVEDADDGEQRLAGLDPDGGLHLPPDFLESRGPNDYSPDPFFFYKFLPPGEEIDEAGAIRYIQARMRVAAGGQKRARRAKQKQDE